MPILEFKLHRRSVPPESLSQLKELSQFLDETANIRPNPRLPWVGAAAFSHKGGTHVNAVQKVIRSYEHVDPSVIGNARHVLISDLAGRSNIVMKARELGFDVTNETPQLRDMLARIKALEHQGYEFESADGSLALLIRRSLTNTPPPFVVDAYNVTVRRDNGAQTCEAIVKVRVGEESEHRVAEGDGPVNALDAALRAALVRYYRQLEHVHLTDYKVRIIDFDERHGGENPRAHRVERRHRGVGHGRRQRQHRRSQPAGARRQPRIRASQEGVGRIFEKLVKILPTPFTYCAGRRADGRLRARGRAGQRPRRPCGLPARDVPAAPPRQDVSGGKITRRPFERVGARAERLGVAAADGVADRVHPHRAIFQKQPDQLRGECLIAARSPVQFRFIERRGQ